MARWVKKKADIRRAELLDAAQALFFSKGYEATTIADIMERAGVSKGGFYYHFAAKDDLLEALGARMAAEAIERLRPTTEQEGLGAVARMNAVLSEARRFKVTDAAAIRAAFDAVFKPENIALYHRLNRTTTNVMVPLFARILQQGKAEGAFRIEDPMATAEIIAHLGASTHDAVARAIEAAGTPQADAASTALDERLRQQGIAIDRILGLPDGTIVFHEPGFSKAVMSVSPGGKN